MPSNLSTHNGHNSTSIKIIYNFIQLFHHSLHNILKNSQVIAIYFPQMISQVIFTISLSISMISIHIISTKLNCQVIFKQEASFSLQEILMAKGSHALNFIFFLTMVSIFEKFEKLRRVEQL